MTFEQAMYILDSFEYGSLSGDAEFVKRYPDRKDYEKALEVVREEHTRLRVALDIQLRIEDEGVHY